MKCLVEYRDLAIAEMQTIYGRRFGSQAVAGLAVVQADLVENGLKNTGRLTDSIRIAATEAIVLVIDPAWADENHHFVMSIGEQSSVPREELAPTHFVD